MNEHDPADEPGARLDAANARIGLRLFAAYTLIYAGFVGLNAFAPASMGRPVFGGLNLAVVYGMGLIAAALALALLYMAACRRNAGRHEPGRGGRRP